MLGFLGKTRFFCLHIDLYSATTGLIYNFIKKYLSKTDKITINRPKIVHNRLTDTL